MAMGPYLSIITLNVNGLNAPTKTQRTYIKSSKGETTNNTQGDSHKDNSWSFDRNSSARREWQDILKVMKENNLQPRLLYPARISFKYERNQKLYRQPKAERIQHHQTSSSANAKGSSLDRKHRKVV